MRQSFAVFLLLLLTAAPLAAETGDDSPEARQKREAIRAQREQLKRDILDGKVDVETVDAALLASIPELIQALNNPVCAVRDEALEKLVQCDHEAMGAIDKALADEHTTPEQRWRLERAQYRIRWNLSAPLLARIADLMDDFETQDPMERRRTVYALETIGGKAALDTMLAIVHNDGNDKVKQAAIDAVARLKIAPDAERYRDALESGRRDLRLGQFDSAIRSFQECLQLQPNDKTAAYNIACTYALQDKVQEAVEWLRTAHEYGFRDAAYILQDPDLASLLDRGEFDDLMRELFGDDYRERYAPKKEE